MAVYMISSCVETSPHTYGMCFSTLEASSPTRLRAKSYEINNKKEYKTVIMRSFVIRL